MLGEWSVDHCQQDPKAAEPRPQTESANAWLDPVPVALAGTSKSCTWVVITGLALQQVHAAEAAHLNAQEHLHLLPYTCQNCLIYLVSVPGVCTAAVASTCLHI